MTPVIGSSSFWRGKRGRERRERDGRSHTLCSLNWRNFAATITSGEGERRKNRRGEGGKGK